MDTRAPQIGDAVLFSGSDSDPVVGVRRATVEQVGLDGTVTLAIDVGGVRHLRFAVLRANDWRAKAIADRGWTGGVGFWEFPQ